MADDATVVDNVNELNDITADDGLSAVDVDVTAANVTAGADDVDDVIEMADVEDQTMWESAITSALVEQAQPEETETKSEIVPDVIIEKFAVDNESDDEKEISFKMDDDELSMEIDSKTSKEAELDVDDELHQNVEEANKNDVTNEMEDSATDKKREKSDVNSRVVFVRTAAKNRSVSDTELAPCTKPPAKARKSFAKTKVKTVNLAPIPNLTIDISEARVGSGSPMSQPSPYHSDPDASLSTSSLVDARTERTKVRKRRRRRMGQYNLPNHQIRLKIAARERQRKMIRSKSLESSDYETARSEFRRSSTPGEGSLLQSDLGDTASESMKEEKRPQVVNVVFNPPGGSSENQNPPRRFVIAPGTVAVKSLSPTKRPSMRFGSSNIVKLMNPEDVVPTGDVAKATNPGAKATRQKMYKLIYPNTSQGVEPVLTSSKRPTRSLPGNSSSNQIAMVTETIGSEAEERRKSAALEVEKDLNLPLCHCKVGATLFSNLVKVNFCQALDSVDGKPVACTNPVTSNARLRPSTKIPFMTMCEIHRQRLKAHQCCPGCGQFCTQGSFFKCKRGPSPVLHYFHKSCQLYIGSRAYCPHCGDVSECTETELMTGEVREAEPRGTGSSQRARMGQALRPSRPAPPTAPALDSAQAPVQTARLGQTVVSSEGVPFGPQREQLERLLVMIDYHKGKKIRSTQKSLYNQACAGDLERVLHLIGEGWDVNYRYPDTNNQTALHAAATNGHYLVCHVLIQAGANVNETDNDLVTPLMKAAEKNRLDIMKLIIIAGANVSAKGEDGMSTLHIAAKDGHFEAVKFLMETRKTDVNILDEGGWTPLIWAAEHRRLDIVRYLLEHGADCNLKDNEENTALHWAAYSGSVDIAELFLDNFSNLEAANEHGDRPLHIAARQEHYECVVLFLARGAISECKNNEGQTPIGCCRNENSPVWMALRVNKQLKIFSEKRNDRVPRLQHRDISFGKERNPISVVNAADDSGWPDDFLYVMENIETSPLNINRVITSLSSCSCLDDCGSNSCVCSRNSLRCWYDKDGRLMEDFNKFEPPVLFECNRQCRCWTSCNNRVVQNGITCRLQLFRTEGRGWGLKTLLDIPQGSFICEYIGEMISDMEADRREDDSYLFDLDNKEGDTYCIDARRYGNIARFINHLCEPNLIPVKLFVDHQDLRFPRICFFSSRFIKAGEELGFDYSEKFWIIKWKQFTCECGSPKCRYSKDVIHKTLAEYHARMEAMEEEYALMEAR